MSHGVVVVVGRGLAIEVDTQSVPSRSHFDIIQKEAMLGICLACGLPSAPWVLSVRDRAALSIVYMSLAVRWRSETSR